MGTPAPLKHPVIFFDGVCNLCNGAVDFIIKRDKRNKFRFASLQSEFAAHHLPKSLTVDPETIVLKMPEGKLYKKSGAALRIAVALNALWPLFGVFLIVPRWIRDPIYDWVARNRYKWFGKRDSCRMPTQEEKLRFYG